ncbi:uncharacterized protein LOC103954346 [Pyrus x bretschneideri]|uniref:uncharacterized protein LOC103954346 n=1 Tax=Pyrus x bretschneideri TaxID=225117 RepID=UPI00202F9C85|nr:uncharacterized protein LOC103954346 [Pyrus x bretschneideri]
MAKRSDFAQKLLDDLRVRKEKMGAPQSSNRWNSMAIDAYACSKQNYRGRVDVSTNGPIGSGGSSRTPIVQEGSNQIVAYGRGGRSSEQMGDFSRALAFALENPGKLGKVDTSSRSSMLGFFNQIGRGAVEFSKMEGKGSANRDFSSSNHFPNLSHHHIEEISKGAHKLNQILEACSNGLNVDRFSIEVGKELVKEAMDLEESLRMLVNLQETSEYIVASQRKNGITLLHEDEDEEDNAVKMAEEKQIDLPSFSFDKGSRHGRKNQEVGRPGFGQKVTAAPTYTTEGSSLNSEKQGKITSSTSVSQRQSVSYTAGVKNPSTEQKESKPKKERIPNVITKLMGLNELPKNKNLKHTVEEDLSSKSKRERHVIEQTTNESSKISGVKTMDPLMQNTTFVSQAGKSMLANNISLGVVVHDPEEFKPVAISGNETIKLDKHQKPTQTFKQDKPVMQAKPGFKEIRVPVEKQNGNNVLPRNQQRKSPYNVELQQQSMAFKSESPKEKRSRKTKEQQIPQPKLVAKKQRRSEMISRSKSKGAVDMQKKQTLAELARVNKKIAREAAATVQSTRVPNGKYHENLVRSKSSADLNFNKKDSSPNSRILNQQKKNLALYRLWRRDQFMQHHHCRRQNLEEKSSSQQIQRKTYIKKQSWRLPFCTIHEVESRSLEKSQTLLPKESYDQQDQAPAFGDDECLTASITVNGNRDICYAEVLEHHKALNLRKQEPQTENENHLKQVVIKSHHFLNTAEALFELDIPFSILHDSGHDCNPDVDSKLTLDCAYEVMKRKGIRHELNVHPKCEKISISFVKVRSLNELVRQLHKDFETLKFYGRKGKYECEAEEYLPKMLESDMHSWEPDVNCMWDMGWDKTMFAVVEVDEVVKDLERLVLSGLVDELTRDLFRTGFSAIH